MVSSSESQQQEHAKAQIDKISALQEQVKGLKTSSRKAESECTSLQSRLAEATRKEEEAQHKVSTLEDNSAMLEQQVESLKGMVSSSESQQQEHAKAQMDKISALQEQVEGLKTSSRKAESECTSLQSRLKAVEDRYRDEIQQLSQAAKTTEAQLAVKYQREAL